MIKAHSFTFLALLCLLIIAPLPLLADWNENGTLVCGGAEWQVRPTITYDGSGGAFVFWEDNRSGSSDIYAQRMDSDGNLLWSSSGVAICTSWYDQLRPMPAPDGSGGAFVTWYDYRSGSDYDIYAQKVDASGNALWTSDGIAIVARSGDQVRSFVISDGAEGAIIVCFDSTSTESHVYAQRINANGRALWEPNGTIVCTASGYLDWAKLISDESGGAIITWSDSRNGDFDIYAQRIDGGGSPVWTANGVPLCTASGDQIRCFITHDGVGGAIISWQDMRSGYYDTYAQRIDASGNTLWIRNGIAVCTAAYDQQWPRLATDGSGGAIITWQDYRNPSANYDIYAQRVDADGSVQWTANGVAICTAIYIQQKPRIISDGAEGAIITWRDHRVPPSSTSDIYAQKIDHNGNALWTPNGEPVGAAFNTQVHGDITTDGAGGAIITWWDYRYEDYDIYAMKVPIESHPVIPESPPVIFTVQDVPHDNGGKLSIQWSRSELDALPDMDISHYSIWRRLPKAEIPKICLQPDSLTDLSAPEGSRTTLFGPDVPADFEGCANRLVSSSADYAWEWMVNVPARSFETYAKTVQSLYDSTSSFAGWQYFIVSAHTYDPAVFFDSEVDSGYSVDNLSPGAPLALTSETIGSDVLLTWEPSGINDEDLNHYSVYRSELIDFTQGPENLLATTSNTYLLDAGGVPLIRHFYVVTATDIHGNESAPSKPTEVSTAIKSPVVPLSFHLYQNVPNPFNPTTVIPYDVPSGGGRVTLRIFDVGGHVVRTVFDGHQSEGQKTVTWDGRDDRGRKLASGVYFCRLTAQGYEKTLKMTLVQ